MPIRRMGPAIGRRAGKVVGPAVRFGLRHWIRHEELIRVRQQIRYLAYAELLRRSNTVARDLTLYELSVFSQNGEDGVLNEILRRLECTRGFFVEIGASVNEANTILLADEFGWSGLYIDASSEQAQELSEKYGPSSRIRVLNEFINAENIESLLMKEDVPLSLDLLSIDIDGNDYWLWQALESFRPKIVVIEVNSHLPSSEVWVQPYEPKRQWDGSRHFGASLGAFCGLANEKGYELVHIDSTGVNAFFLDREHHVPHRFLSTSEVMERVPNYFLYGLRHPG